MADQGERVGSQEPDDEVTRRLDVGAPEPTQRLDGLGSEPTRRIDFAPPQGRQPAGPTWTPVRPQDRTPADPQTPSDPQSWEPPATSSMAPTSTTAVALPSPVPPPGSRRPDGRRRRRWVGALVAGLLVITLVVGAFLGDGVARTRTEDSVAGQVATALGVESSQVDVSIGGWPFLAVLATDRLASIDVTSPTARFTKDSRTVTFSDISFHATGVNNARESTRTTFDSVTARGRISYTELSSLAGATITSAGSGRVTLKRTARVLGINVSIDVTAEPGIDPSTRQITLANPTATVEGVSIPSSLLAPTLAAVVSRAVLPDLGSLTYESLTASANGLVVNLSGKDVRLSDLQPS